MTNQHNYDAATYLAAAKKRLSEIQLVPRGNADLQAMRLQANEAKRLIDMAVKASHKALAEQEKIQELFP